MEGAFMNKNLLIIFTRNPKLGKVKTRLSATIGNDSALKIYKFLLDHTVSVTKNLLVEKQVHYSVKVRNNDIWDNSIFNKKQQYGKDLGERMENAIQKGFEDGFKNIILIGSDLYDISQLDIEAAFNDLKNHNFVLGPAEDGGYYLLGMRMMKPPIFKHKKWGSNTVLKDTLSNLNNESYKLLPIRNDIDIFEDIKEIKVFQQFLK